MRYSPAALIPVGPAVYFYRYRYRKSRLETWVNPNYFWRERDIPNTLWQEPFGTPWPDHFSKGDDGYGISNYHTFMAQLLRDSSAMLRRSYRPMKLFIYFFIYRHATNVEITDPYAFTQTPTLGFGWHHLIARPWKPSTRRKHLGDISYRSWVIANFASNFVAMATGVGRGRIYLASFNSPSPKTPCYTQKSRGYLLYKPSYSRFCLKFRCHGNRGHPGVNLNDAFKLAVPENHTIEPKSTTLSCVQPELWQFK